MTDAPDAPQAPSAPNPAPSAPNRARSAPQAFDAYASDYDAPRHRLVPNLEMFYGTAVEAVWLGRWEPLRVLDLGAGTGLLSARIRHAYPDAHLTLLDGSARMLALARQRLGDDCTEYVEADLNDPLPGEDWDAVVSALAIHHLSDAGKRALMTRILKALRPGGIFVNAEQVTGPSPLFTDAYAAWHEAQARANGSDDTEWAGAVERMTHDDCATVEDQLIWLTEAGFTQADCLFKTYQLAVLAAIA